MNANQIAFGIEFETTLPNSDTTPIGPYHHGYQVPWLPTGWRAERDASINPETPNRVNRNSKQAKSAEWLKFDCGRGGGILPRVRLLDAEVERRGEGRVEMVPGRWGGVGQVGLNRGAR